MPISYLFTAAKRNKISFARKNRIKLLSSFVLLLVLNLLHSTNGMNMIGYGARSASMGGISLGLLGNTFGLNTNPASISFISKKQIEAAFTLLNPHVRYKNDLNSGTELSKKDLLFMPSIAYVHGSKNKNFKNKFRWGIGFFSQSGMGVDYQDINYTIYNEPQKVSSNIGYYKIVPTFAYQFSKNFSIGLSPFLSYAELEMKMPFSLDANLMQGNLDHPVFETFADLLTDDHYNMKEISAYSEIENANGIGFGGKIGVVYRVNKKLVLGAGFLYEPTIELTSTADMDMATQFSHIVAKIISDDERFPDIETPDQVMAMFAQMGFDVSNPAEAFKVKYDAAVEISWPIELGIGFKYSILKNWMIGADVKWLNWEKAMKEFKMSFKNSDNTNIDAMIGNDNINISLPMNWEDQFTISIGSEYILKKRYAFRIGYNYGMNPVPANTTIPLFPAIIEHHVTAGFGYSIIKYLKLNFAYELNIDKKVDSETSIISGEYNNSNNRLFEQIGHVSIIFNF